jgi:hypothetical protein
MVVVSGNVLQNEENKMNREEAGFMVYYRQLSVVEGLKRHIGMITERGDPVGDRRVLEKILNNSIMALNVIGANQVSGHDGIIRRDYDVTDLEGNYRRNEISPESLGTYIVCLDLDNFGKINKECGDSKGDELITIVANSLSRTLRDTDGISCVSDKRANLRENGFEDFIDVHGMGTEERKAYHLHGDEYELFCSVGSERDLVNVLVRCRDNMLDVTGRAGYSTGVTMGYSLWDIANESFATAEERAVVNRNDGKLKYGRGVIVGLDGKPVK